jgi:hypothetical protein
MARLPYPYEDVFETDAKPTQQAVGPPGHLWNLDGATIIASDGVFLGKISRNPFDAESVSNQFGIYGSKYSAKSIFNQYGLYGSQFSAMSPYNQFTSTPPKIMKGGTLLGHLTVNKFIMNRIDPEELAAWLNVNTQ